MELESIRQQVKEIWQSVETVDGQFKEKRGVKKASQDIYQIIQYLKYNGFDIDTLDPCIHVCKNELNYYINYCKQAKRAKKFVPLNYEHEYINMLKQFDCDFLVSYRDVIDMKRYQKIWGLDIARVCSQVIDVIDYNIEPSELKQLHVH